MIRFARTKMRGYHYDPRDGGFSLALLSSRVSSMNATSPAPIAELHHPAFRWANTMLANIKNSLLATHRVCRQTSTALPRRLRLAVQPTLCPQNNPRAPRHRGDDNAADAPPPPQTG
jgi:hypothetical protein